VEIDRRVVNVSRQYLPEISGGAYEDPRVELHIADGVDFVASTDERFDVVLVDSTDPVGPAAPLIGATFLGSAREVLTSPGLMVMQSGSPLTQPREWVATVSAFKRAFPVVRPYLGWVPIYPGVIWSWVAGSREIDPSAIDNITVSGRLGGLRNQLRIYNPEVHRAAFALPSFVQHLAGCDRPPTAADLRGIGHPLPSVVPD
jgi:spermidine synthase